MKIIKIIVFIYLLIIKNVLCFNKIQNVNQSNFIKTENNNVWSVKRLSELNNTVLLPKNYFDYKQIYGLRYEPKNQMQIFDNNKIDSNEQSEIIVNFIDNDNNSLTSSINWNNTLSTIVGNNNGKLNPPRIYNAVTLIKDRIKQLLYLALEQTQGNNSLDLAKFEHFPNISVNLNLSVPTTGRRFLNLFKVIRFPNDPCSATQKPLRQLFGTCYHKLECDQLRGLSIGHCANGYGVCCIFKLNCGTTTSQNISYFESPGYPNAFREKLSCTLTVNLLPEVQQVLIDFLFFELRPPTDGTCNDDQFVINGQNKNSLVPTICGINTGQHMFIDVNESIENRLYLTVFATSPEARAFSIRITQLKDNLAPRNCLQYHRGQTGVLQTFNYNNDASIVQSIYPSYFNNLNYAVCIKRSPGYCTISYSNEMDGVEDEFQLLNYDEEGLSIIPPLQAGAEIFNCADDFITINGVRLCGEKLNDGTYEPDFTKNAIIVDYTAGPIIIPVKTNERTVGRGFKLYYSQNPCEN